jgi:hypothetical protein
MISDILQRIMESLLSDLEVLPFLDDITIASLTKEDHIAKVGKVLHRFIYEADCVSI